MRDFRSGDGTSYLTSLTEGLLKALHMAFSSLAPPRSLDPVLYRQHASVVPDVSRAIKALLEAEFPPEHESESEIDSNTSNYMIEEQKSHVRQDIVRIDRLPFINLRVGIPDSEPKACLLIDDFIQSQLSSLDVSKKSLYKVIPDFDRSNC